MKVLLFRHGAVLHGDARLFLGRTDLPLSPEGRCQAEAWRNRLQGRLPGSIVSSPLRRALEFARILSGDAAADIAVCPELAEIDLGAWDGRPMHDIRRTAPDAWQARGEDLARFRPPGGESFADLQNRVLPVFQRLIERCDSELTVVAHAGVNRVLLCHLLGMPLAHLFRIDQDYACLNVLESSRAGIRVRRVNVPCPARAPESETRG